MFPSFTEQGGRSEAVDNGHKVVKCPEVWMSRKQVTEQYKCFLKRRV